MLYPPELRARVCFFSNIRRMAFWMNTIEQPFGYYNTNFQVRSLAANAIPRRFACRRLDSHLQYDPSGVRSALGSGLPDPNPNNGKQQKLTDFSS
jgi:hypothetical protein